MVSSRLFFGVNVSNALGRYRPLVSHLINGLVTPLGRTNRRLCNSFVRGRDVEIHRHREIITTPRSTYCGRPIVPPSSPPGPKQPKEDDDKPPGLFQRFKNMYKKYRYIVGPVHLLTSAVWFGSFYLLTTSGIDVPALIDSLEFPGWIVDKMKNGVPWTKDLVITYGLFKIFTPLRYMVTIFGTRMAVRLMRKFGYADKNPKGGKNSQQTHT